MAKKVLKANIFSPSSIQELQKQLGDYKNSLNDKCEQFVRELAESGISVAKQSVGNFGKYITFSVKTEKEQNGCKGVLFASNTGIIKSEWRTQDGVKTADVSPLLMAEFGSGMKAENPMNVPGVGQGTFPGGTHGNDPSGWWWMDLNGEWHHSRGVTPTMPMYHASLEMITQIQDIARRVFGQ